MATQFELNHLVFHYLGIEDDRDEPGTRRKYSRQAGQLQEIDALPPVILDHLLDLIAATWQRPDKGVACSARFEQEPEDEDAKLVAGYLAAIKRDVWSISAASASAQEWFQARQHFLALSQQIDTRLYDVTPLGASPGLLMVADFTPSGRTDRHLALLKIRHDDARLVRILQDSLTDLEVEEVDMILTKEVLKGAIWPHPSRADYDLKIVDYQARGRPPAHFFAGAFLGCRAKEPDARQAARVSEVLPNEVARDLGARLVSERTYDYVEELVRVTRPTAQQVAELAAGSHLIEGVETAEVAAAVEEQMGDTLADVRDAQELEPALASLAAGREWTYQPEQQESFLRQMGDVLALDEKKVARAMVQKGLVAGVDEEDVEKALRAKGILDVPRGALFQHTRNLEYRFKVRRRPDSGDFVWITIRGPRETIQRFLTRDSGGEYVFSIQASAERFETEYQ